MKFGKTFRAAMAGAALYCMAAPAAAAVPVYPEAGIENPFTYVFTATNTGSVIAYFAGSTASLTNVLSLRVNGIDTGIFGLNNQTSGLGDMLDFGSVNAGDELTFFINVIEDERNWYSDRSLNDDGVNHVWSTAYEGGDFDIPAGQFVAFEDLEGGGDFNYGDLGFVFTNVDTISSAVPEPSTWMMMLAGFGIVGSVVRRRKSSSIQFA